MAEGEYVYCIISRKEAPKNFGVKGIEDNPVYGINCKDLTAVVSQAPMKEFEPTEENVEKHKRVALHVLKKCTVLPVAFGMVFKSRRILLSTMLNVYLLLKRSLMGAHNKVELGVKAIFPKGIDFETHANGKSREEFIKECEESFYSALNSLAVKSKKDKLFSEKLVYNYSFLVDRNEIEKFSGEIEKLDKKCNPLKIQYTGPWPPYNFVDIRIMSRGRSG